MGRKGWLARFRFAFIKRAGYAARFFSLLRIFFRKAILAADFTLSGRDLTLSGPPDGGCAILTGTL